MDNDVTPKGDEQKNEDAISASPNIESSSDEVTSDGFGSIGNELEPDKEALEEAEKAKLEEEEKKKAEIIDGPVILTDKKAEKKEKSHKRSKVLAVIAVLLLIGCGVGAYFFLQPQEESKKNAQSGGGTEEEKSEYRLAGNGLSDFDLKFLQLENKDDKNLIYSPLSIKYALAMLKDGAGGNTKTQIENIIGDYSAKKYINSRNLTLANAMFIRDSYKDQVLDSYINGLKTNYNASVVFDSFKSPTTINKWVSDQTLNLVNDIMTQDDINKLDYALINALAIDQKWNYLLQCTQGSKVPCGADWNNGFSWSVDYAHEKYSQYVSILHDENSYESMTFGDLKDRKSVEIGASFNNYDIFKEVGEDKIKSTVSKEYKKWLNTEDGKTVVEGYKNYHESDEVDPSDVDAVVQKYMNELKGNYGKGTYSTDFYINDSEDAKVFAKDLKEYDGNTLQYVAIMPKEESLKDYAANLKAENVTELIDGLKELKNDSFEDGVVTRIKGKIPLYKYNYDFGLIKDLQEMGVKDVFSEEADLSGMIKEEGAYINTAKHAATIEFSNEGIKAGAATVLGGAGGGGNISFEYLWDVPVKEIDISFDKPFLYLIRDKNTGEVWFTGAVYEPLKNTNKQ